MLSWNQMDGYYKMCVSEKDINDFKSLYRAASFLFSSPSLNATLQKLILLAKDVLSADYCSILLIDEEGNLVDSIEVFRGDKPLKSGNSFCEITTQVLRTGLPIIINDTRTSAYKINPYIFEEGICSIAAIPLLTNGKPCGVLLACSETHDKFKEQFIMLSTFAVLISIALQNTMIIEGLQDEAIRDYLTGAFNCRYFQERLEEEIQRVKHTSSVFSLLIFDFDNFKTLNDIHGHSLGNEALKAIADTAFKVLDEDHVFARYGGDEFIVLLPDTNKKEAKVVAKRLMNAIRSIRFPLKETSLVVLSASMGLVTCPFDGLSAEELLTRADMEMFKAKRMGGNQISVYNDCYNDNILDDEIMDNFIYALSRAIDLKDRSAFYHSQIVSHYATLIAKELGLLPNDIIKVKRAALLHDIGKFAVSDDILQKSGLLREDEWEVMKNHSSMGAEILKYIPGFGQLSHIIKATHERYDGLGYPDGLEGDEIPIEARIIAVVDVYCTLRSKRSYREAYSKDDAIKYIKATTGSEFDPEIVEVFLKILGDE